MLGEHMEAEILEQPNVLSRGAAGYYSRLREFVGGREFEMVLLAARGSSDNAALYGRYLIEINLGIPVSLAAPSVLTRYGRRIRYPRCLAVGISQSGAAPDVAEVLEALRDEGHATLAITNTAGSRLSEAAEHALILEAGPELAVAATKTYTASLLALYELVRALGARIPSPGPILPGHSFLESSHAWARESVGNVLRAHMLFALGRGYSFASAHESALKLMECALLPCKAYSLADFQHGPKALATHGATAIVYGSPSGDLAGQGADVLSVDCPSGEALAPIWEAFHAQWLALLCARARGLDPDAPPHLSKITKTR